MDNYKVLQRFFPAAAVDYCFEIWTEHSFAFKIKRKRLTKLGDYKYDPRTGRHTITVNNDLNPYSFLVTYIHEVAHLVTFKKYKRSVPPHGKEWKHAFKQLMQPLLSSKVFPPGLLAQVIQYMKDPKASSCNDHGLAMALAQYDKNRPIVLQEIETGSLFRLGKRTFKKEELKRTRYVCLEVKSGKRYLVSRSAPVDKVDPN